MFVAQVVGQSMEPRIPDGSSCLFLSPVKGSRQGKIVLVQLRDETDPESGAHYTVKRYESEKSFDEDDTWRQVKITLTPLNTSFGPIVLAEEDEDSIAVIAEFLQVICADAGS
jgi:phage repressor protein C with HTH and peptisase S24 domain